MKPIITFLCAVLLTIASQVSGQNMSTSFSAVPLPGQPPFPIGDQLTVTLNVTNFTNISSVLLPIAYNSAVLRFDSIDNPAIPEFVDTFATSYPTQGLIRINWFPSLINYPDGFTIPGTNARMLTLRFTVIGNGTANINLTTTGGTPIEVVNSVGVEVFNNIIYQNGGSSGNGVTIVGGSGTPLVGFKIIGNDVYAKQGHRVCVPITVNHFDSIQLLTYAMHWDNTKLNYDCVRGATNPVVPTFNAPALAPGTLLLSWEDPNLLSGVGVSKPNGSRIYEVCFNTVGAPGTQTTITFDGLGFYSPPDFTTDIAEATNAAGINLWTNASHPNGPSGVSSKVFIMSEPPGGSPITFTADKDTIAPTMQTCVGVKVKNFTAVTESEFLMTYDATKLTFVGPITIPVTALGLLPANVTHTLAGNTGTIKFKWSNAAGVTLADNTVIFSACFNAIGAAGSVVPIAFGTSACPNPTPYAAFRKSSGGAPYKMEDGSVTIMSTGPTLTPVPTQCNVGATGAINVNPNGTATGYIWSNGATTQNLTNVAAGTYTVTVTYSGGATATSSAPVTAPPAINMTQVAVGVTCFGDSNGSIDITPSGGTGTYTYLWNGPMSYTATSQDIAGVKTGNYVVTITDSHQCAFASAAVNVSSPQPIAVPSNSIVITTVSCFGGSNGAINIAPTGGTSPYTYDWSNDGAENPDNDPQNIVGLPSGTYSVTITDTRGCSFIPSGLTVSQPAALVPTFVGKTDVKCFGSATGTATITVTGGSGNKTYSWKKVSDNSQVSTDQNPTNLPAGTYNVVVTDGNGCTAIMPSPVVIADAPSALTLSVTTQPGLCFGQLTGSIDLTVNGGWGNYSYAWTSGLPAVPDPAPVSSGTYTVTVTDVNLCTATQTAVVGGAQTAINIGNPVVSNVTCHGQGNGGICLNLSGGNGGAYQVSWSNTSLTGACIGALPGGTYAPTVTDGSSCTAVFTGIQVVEPLELLLDTTVTAANPTGAIDLIVTGGTANYTYQWAGAGGPLPSNEDLTGMPAGTYTVTVTDANGCSKIATYSIPSANVLIGTVVTNVSHSCNNDGCINISIPATAAANGPYTLSWATGATPPTSSLAPAACGLAAGPYVVTVTAGNGNTVTVTAIVNQLQQALIGSSNTSQPFDNLSNGSITITPTFPNCTFVWNNGSTAATLTNLDQGNYVVTVTNNTSGCTAEYTYTLVRQYLPYVFTITEATSPACASSTTGSIKIAVTGGDGPNYTYQWSGPNGYTATTKDIVNLSPGSYSLTVTDESGVTRTHGPIDLVPNSALAITNVNELSFTPGGTQVSGANVCDGEAAVVFTGQVGNATILWSNGATTPTTSTLCGGTYSVTITDSQGCTATWSDALTVPAAIGSSSVATTPKCFGDVNGTAKVFVTGGIEPYEVAWSNGQFDQLVFSNTFSEAVSLESGTYTVTITDVNDVTQTATVVVPDAPQIGVSFTGVDPNNFNSCDGERIAFVTGATDPISYTWSGSFGHSGNTVRAEGLCSGEILQYVIVDANNCTVSVVDSVPYPEDGCFLVRPVLTPAEQDGNNDYTLITCIESAAHTVEIYNRWGQLVFQTESYTNNPSDPENTWTGFTRTGQALPEGVYYYVLTYIDDEDNQHQVKGYINLLK